MNYTPNYHLPTWAKADRIQMADFNDMTAKLDAALKTLAGQVGSKGNCQLYTTSYTGDGKDSRTLTFPVVPALIVIASMYNGAYLLAANGVPTAYAQAGGNAYMELSWSGRSVTFSRGMNDSGIKFKVYVLTA